ncbi:KATNB1-like protein 1 [Astyanax mexicanus]|uniref:KATNB1-like protein 1 n=1 Tax=Astyanax mexicanus TaxID=7994 RepID=UPI0020CB1F3E|nr:KATNB1-like protein 1 [Astyanax mexicanus]XP_049319495.1 KATNB1-like protein 1 [Astyanax mexicanus]
MPFTVMSSEENDYEESDGSEENLTSEEQTYRVRVSHYTEMGFSNKKEPNKKRVKRVVSCKRKTRHLTVSSGIRRRPSINAKTFEAFNKDNENTGREESLDGGRCGFPLSVALGYRMEEENIKHFHYLSEISKDHKRMAEILFGRNLRLNIALTLWRRNIGELLSFLIKIQDLSVLVDCLPVFTNSLRDKHTHVTAGFCVDLFPLVNNVLKSHYKDYLVIALLWIQAVLVKWLPELSQNVGSAFTICSSDYKNIHAIKQQLRALWRYQLRFTTEATAEIWKDIVSLLYPLRLC